jgi:hypothetical protein
VGTGAVAYTRSCLGGTVRVLSFDAAERTAEDSIDLAKEEYCLTICPCGDREPHFIFGSLIYKYGLSPFPAHLAASSVERQLSCAA